MPSTASIPQDSHRVVALLCDRLVMALFLSVGVWPASWLVPLLT
ncbi:MAG: hypothetical protein V4617_18555 [Gemmatimonadota bacterium]